MRKAWGGKPAYVESLEDEKQQENVCLEAKPSKKKGWMWLGGSPRPFSVDTVDSGPQSNKEHGREKNVKPRLGIRPRLWGKAGGSPPTGHQVAFLDDNDC